MNGTIKKKMDKGFGFIKVDGFENDLFFHRNALVGVDFNDLREGDSVTFNVEDSPKGKNATEVRRV